MTAASPPVSSLTDRQVAIIEFIEACLTDPDRRYPPSVREIGEAIGLASTSSVHHQLRQLEKVGVIRRAGNRSRAITLIEDAAPAA